MEQQRTKLTAASSSPASPGSSSSSSRSIHGSMSSTFLGMSSSSTRSHSQRRSSPPASAPLPGHFASRGSAASGGYASGSSSSQLHQISPSPGTAARRRSRPHTQVTHALPTPFLTELSAIRRMGANVFGDLNAQEMTRSSLSLTMPRHSHHHTPIMPSGEFSGFPSASQQQQALNMRGLPGFAPPPLQQQQAQPQPSFSSLQPLPGGDFFGFPSPASQPQHMQPYSFSSTDLTRRTFSAFESPAESQHFSTYLAPLPRGSTIFQSSSSCSADHAQPWSSDSELPPLPPSLEIQQCDLRPLGHLSLNNGSSTVVQSRSAFVQPSETYELAPFPESLQTMPPLLLQQVKQEPVAVVPWLEPEIISLDDGDELSAVAHSFASSHGHGSAASFPTPMHEKPTNLEVEGMHRLQLGGSSSELNMKGAVEGVGVGQTCRQAMPTPASTRDKVNNGGGGSRSIPWNCRGPMPMYSWSEEQALQQLSNLLSRWSSTESSSSDQSMGSSIAGSSAMPALANKFDMMSIGGSSSSAGPQMPWNYSSLSDAEMEKINKDNRLKELVKTDSKRVKRILRNREYVARLKMQKAKHLEALQRQADALKMECSSLSSQVQSHQEMFDKLRTENRAMEIKLNGLKELDNLKHALNHQLQSELQRLKLHS